MNAPLTAGQRAALQHVSLDDKYTLERGRAWMSGIQALVRLPMLQRERDRAAGLNTAGFISGYRGSPLGGLDQNLVHAKAHLARHQIHFTPGLNEELAATAVWGSQQVNLHPGARHDGVFGMWYGKGPGVDRCGDVFKHANAAGTSTHGGVLVLAGDDHPAKSSTLPHQSEHILKAAMLPVLFPSSVQEYLDLGLHGWAMSRYAGVWVGMKCLTDIVEASASVEIATERVSIITPEDFTLPAGGLNIRWPDTPLQQEARLLDYKLYAALAYARANRLNHTVWDVPQARFGIAASGKAYLDTRQALQNLGLDQATCRRIGLRLYKVAMVWPLEAQGVREFAEGLDEILVVEEKRQVLEYQIKEELFSWIGSGKKIPRVIGKFDEKDGGEWAVPQGNWILPAHYELDPARVAKAIGARLLRTSLPDQVRAGIQAHLAVIQAKERELARPRVVTERKPWFCPGCPHNTSTRVPEGSRAVAGIGCHYMVTWMDRSTATFTQMGGEGTPWIGQAPFTDEKHIFANLGDGTYLHSGSLAVRAALAAGVSITYKILFNDAVAMTGGQPFDAPLSVPAITRQMAAEGVQRIVVVTDEPARYRQVRDLAPGVTVHHRDELDAVQRELREYRGVSVLVYEQTCAAEKRRRRKRGTYPDPARRVLINERVCEGCGDCSDQSNCLAVEPLPTELGRKRTINQSSCNKDYSCLNGFCPSFVTVEGGQLRKGGSRTGLAGPPQAPPAALPSLAQPYGIVVAGIGGTGVVTIGQLIGMAAHLEGKGCSVLDMAGLAQKGGAVHSHVVLAATPAAIHSTRVAMGEARLILAADLVVGTSQDTLARARAGHTYALVNRDLAPTSAFIHNPDWTLPGSDLENDLARACGGPDRVTHLDATRLAVTLTGDAIHANPLLLGFAWQRGWLPVGHAALRRAIELNGTAIEANLAAFEWGRALAHDAGLAARVLTPAAGQLPDDPDTEVGLAGTRDDGDLSHVLARRVAFLTQYQSARYAARYREFVLQIADQEQARTGTHSLALAVARNLFKLMAYKDEYEVARLYTDGQFLQRVAEQFEGDYRLRVHLAPPVFARRDARGHLRKRAYGPWMFRAFRLLAPLRFLRGSRLDPFGYTAERRAERALIEAYRQTIEQVVSGLSPASHANALALARLPEDIRGFGHIKEANLARVAQRRAELLEGDRPRPGSVPTRRAA